MMKHLFALLLLLPFAAFAQNCKLKKDKDNFGSEKLTTGFVTLGNTRLSIDADNKEIDLFFSLGNSGICFDDQSTAVFQYELKNQKANQRNSGTMNCDGYFHVTFRNTTMTASALQKLGTQKLKSITFTGNGKTTKTLELDEAQQKIFMEMINCVITEAKTLLPK